MLLVMFQLMVIVLARRRVETEAQVIPEIQIIPVDQAHPNRHSSFLADRSEAQTLRIC
jgi:hypothetical protein